MSVWCNKSGAGCGPLGSACLLEQASGLACFWTPSPPLLRPQLHGLPTLVLVGIPPDRWPTLTSSCSAPASSQIHGLPTLIFVGMDANKPALRTEGLLPAQVRDMTACCHQLVNPPLFRMCNAP